MGSRAISRWIAAVAGAVLLMCLAGCAWLDNTESGAGVEGVQAQVISQPPEPEPEPDPRSFTMVAVGDVMLDRWVWSRIQANGPQSIFEKVRDALRDADITFANLECPLAETGPHAPKNCIFRADPRAVDVLLDGGIDVVSVANNHSLDAGAAGLLSTLDHLDRAGIAYCGAAREREASWEPCLFEVNDVTLGFVACTDLSFVHGSWCKVDEETTKFAERIRAAKKRCELLVVSIHWGNEYQSVPTQRQRTVAEAAAEGRVTDEGWRVRRDGSRFWAFVTITALFDDGDLQGYVKVTRDMTDRKRHEDRLAALNDLLASFLQTEDPEAVWDSAIDAAAERLELPTTAGARFDDSVGELRPVATTPMATDHLDVEGLLDD
ncbi:MAG: CapA family protein, partial [Armatimonadota bacterium]